MTGIHNTPGDGAGYTNTVCPHLFVAPDDLVAGRHGLGVVALRYAALGLPVFPLKPGTKKPDCKNGFKDATTDPAVIERWWTENRFRGIGIATGAVSGAAIVDLDRKNGKDGPASFAAWSAGLGLNLPWRPWAGTPSGGIHEL